MPKTHGGNRLLAPVMRRWWDRRSNDPGDHRGGTSAVGSNLWRRGNADSRRSFLSLTSRGTGRHGQRREGGVATVDTTQSIPIVVLGHVPSVGDILPAFAVGGRWVGSEAGMAASRLCVHRA